MGLMSEFMDLNIYCIAINIKYDLLILQNFYANMNEKNKTMLTFKKIKIRFISKLSFKK